MPYRSPQKRARYDTSGLMRPTRQGTRAAAPRRNSKWRRAKRGLARFSTNRRFARSGYTLSRVLNSIAETKLLAITSVDEANPQSIQAGAVAYFKNYCIGPAPAPWTQMNALGGMTIPQGDAGGQRDGLYIYLQKTHVKLNIDMQFNKEVVPPHEFRVLVGKAKRVTNPAGFTKDPTNTLLLDSIGNPFGTATAGKNGTDLMMQPVNRRDWYVKHDMKFRLSAPLATVGGGYTGFLPTMKNMTFNLGYYHKTRMSSTNLPADIDYSWFIIIYARCIDKDVSANGWEMNLRGTTSFKDV